jgi:hypothetical protein
LDRNNLLKHFFFNLAWKLFETYWNLLKHFETTFWNHLKPFEFHYFAWFGCSNVDVTVNLCRSKPVSIFLWALEHFFEFCLCCSAAMEGKRPWTWTGIY